MKETLFKSRLHEKKKNQNQIQKEIIGNRNLKN